MNGIPQRAEPAHDVTVLEGSSFFLSGRNGDINPQRAHGLFVRDTRIISTWQLLLDDEPLEALSVMTGEPFAATFITRAATRAGRTEPTVVVERRRAIGDTLREDIVVRNYGEETLGARLLLEVDSDFADLFDVKEGGVATSWSVDRHAEGDWVELTVVVEGHRRGARVVAQGAHARRGGLFWQLAVPAHDEWRTSVEVHPEPITGATDSPSRRSRDWRRSAPTVTCENSALQETLERSVDDLGALRMTDPGNDEHDVVAAGAPWFMALFGRDSLITSLLTIAWDPDIARGTLHTLARLQGRQEDVLSEEEPGRILHEARLGLDDAKALGQNAIYYGSVDATPLFVMLVGAAAQWGLPEDDVRALLPAADRALAWIEEYGDRDGDGFVEYQRKTDRGLLNQGWKDSQDSITFRDGRRAHGPIALAEVQGYVYGAYLARAQLAEATGDAHTAQRCRERAATLRERFDAAFWLPEHGYYALALDGEKRPVDALASNQGHCLWTGLAQDERVSSVAEHLISPDMFTGWGVRTLGESMAAFNPVSYHNGSVWPHDNALIVLGLVRYGCLPAAHLVAEGIIDAAAHFDGRLPELFCGFSRADMPVLVSYPTSCSPQAWAAATPIGLVTALLGLTPDPAAGTVRAAGALPPGWGRVQIEGLHVGRSRVSVGG